MYGVGHVLEPCMLAPLYIGEGRSGSDTSGIMEIQVIEEN
jgi:hypothetical protein